jgi:hypothetical protein
MKRLAKVPWRKLVVATDFRRTPQPLAKLREGGAGPFQPSRSERRTAAAGQYALALIARTRDPFARSTRACEQISCSICVTSISVVGRHSNALGISPGQMRHAEPSLSSTIWLLSCFLICIADLRAIESECLYCIGVDISGAQRCQPSGATARVTIRPKGECADGFFRERRDRSAPLPESNRIPPLRGPDR